MQLYIFRNNQQLGPFEENVVLDQLRNGQLSPDDLGIREGDSNWLRLGDIFAGRIQYNESAPAFAPHAAQPEGGFAVRAPSSGGPNATTGNAAPLFRKTLLHKIFFGLCTLGALVIAVGAIAYWRLQLGPSGDLMTDLGNAPFRGLAVYAGIGFAVMAVLSFLAFLLTFKRKIIASGGLRIALRIFFILPLIIGLVFMAYSVFSYLNWSPAASSLRLQKGDPGYEMLEKLDQSEAIAGPLTGLVLFLPIGLGFALFGLSGFAMATGKGTTGAPIKRLQEKSI
jgi:hypothetical protein